MLVHGIEISIIKKRIKNIYIRVKRNGEVIVTAPYNCSDKRIEDFVNSKADWIIDKRTEALKNNRAQIGQIPDSIMILGKEYPVSYYRGSKNDIFFDGSVVHITTKGEATPEITNKLKDKLYKKTTDIMIEKLLPIWSDKMNLYPSEWKVMKMNSMWGNCRPESGKVHFSLNLASTPIEFIEYVIVHELAHLKEKNHSQRFWHLVEKYVPNYREIRKKYKRKIGN